MIPMFSGAKDFIEINRSFFLAEDTIPDIVISEPVKVVGNIVNMSGYMKLTLEINMKYKTECARCLCPLDETFILDFDKTVAVAGTLENEDTDEVITEYIIISENKLNLVQVITEQLLFEFPSKHICSENCRGLCQICGHALNESNCGCKIDKIDPRFEVLKSLLEKPSDQKEEIDD